MVGLRCCAAVPGSLTYCGSGKGKLTTFHVARQERPVCRSLAHQISSPSGAAWSDDAAPKRSLGSLAGDDSKNMSALMGLPFCLNDVASKWRSEAGEVTQGRLRKAKVGQSTHFIEKNLFI